MYCLKTTVVARLKDDYLNPKEIPLHFPVLDVVGDAAARYMYCASYYGHTPEFNFPNGYFTNDYELMAASEAYSDIHREISCLLSNKLGTAEINIVWEYLNPDENFKLVDQCH